MDPDFQPLVSVTSHLTSTSELQDLVRDPNLSKNEPELLASILQGRDLQKVSLLRKRQKDLTFFSMGSDLAFRSDVHELMKALE
jgi:hypothetical protein